MRVENEAKRDGQAWQTTCISCGATRPCSYHVVLLIRHGVSSGWCRSCAQTLNATGTLPTGRPDWGTGYRRRRRAA